LWVFSGRRGLHGWIFDKEVMSLKSNQRSALLSYMDVPFSQDGSGRRSISNIRHRYLKRLLRKSQTAFHEIIIKDQNLLNIKDFRVKLLEMIPYEGTSFFLSIDLRRDLQNAWSNIELINSEIAWSVFEAILQQSRSKSFEELQRLKAEIVITFMTPRIDVNVTSQINHLIKSPFSAHPDTGKISIPLNMDSEHFDPKKVCTHERFHSEEYSLAL
jgi:DNA primase small subunit